MSDVAQPTSAKRMGAWVIEMADLSAAHEAVKQCMAAEPAALEVRHTLWGVQIITESDRAASFLTTHYAPQASAAVALAA